MFNVTPAFSEAAGEAFQQIDYILDLANVIDLAMAPVFQAELSETEGRFITITLDEMRRHPLRDCEDKIYDADMAEYLKVHYLLDLATLSTSEAHTRTMIDDILNPQNGHHYALASVAFLYLADQVRFERAGIGFSTDTPDITVSERGRNIDLMWYMYDITRHSGGFIPEQQIAAQKQTMRAKDVVNFKEFKNVGKPGLIAFDAFNDMATKITVARHYPANRKLTGYTCETLSNLDAKLLISMDDSWNKLSALKP